MVFDQMGFGKPLADFSPEGWSQYLHEEYGPSLRMLANAATSPSRDRQPEARSLRRGTIRQSSPGEIKAGTVAAQRFIIAVHGGGQEVVRLDQYAYVSKDVNPPWDIRRTDGGCG
jgi:hypothetical protein